MDGFPWPDGRRAAVALTFDVDGESIAYVRDPEGAQRRLSFMSEHAYGPEVGLGRILELLDLYELSATFYMPGFVAELHPDRLEAIARAGHGVGCHGYMHERPNAGPPELEAEILDRACAVFRGILGRAPVAYRSPSWELTPASPALLVERGFTSDSSLMGDDVPYLVRTERGDLLELPIHWTADDFIQFGRTWGIASPAAALDVFTQEFQGLYERGGLFVMTMHPFLTGRPSRLLVLERLIRFMRQFPRVWWTTIDGLAEYCRRPEVATGLRVVQPEIPPPRWVG
jgi:peptidoglycan/xylan/chitin deacetylase (PgdA/CDA1 family)